MFQGGLLSAGAASKQSVFLKRLLPLLLVEPKGELASFLRWGKQGNSSQVSSQHGSSPLTPNSSPNRDIVTAVAMGSALTDLCLLQQHCLYACVPSPN